MPENRPADSRITNRQKLILSGLYLSKFDSLGVKKLGFGGFVEAFNVIGYALGSRPASIKNYRDEFDPLFPNRRKGWHKRPIREYCREIFDQYKHLDFDSFTGLVRSFFDVDERASSEITPTEQNEDGASAFSQRLITGLAAEKYFESIHAGLAEFEGRVAENTTRYGCGYDFRLHSGQDREDFWAVEVKGLRAQTGSISLTPKEHGVASALGERFFLFVVRNFQETPSHSIFKNPLVSGLQFRRMERVTVQVSWLTSI